MNSLFDINTALGRRVEGALSALVVLAVSTLIAETLVDEGSLATWIVRLEIVFGAIFGLEYLLRIVTSDKRRRYIFSFYGVVDLLAALSSLVLLPGLGAVKILRVFRAFRIFKLVRYTDALGRFSRAFDDIKDELAIYLCATGILTFIASYGIYVFEHEENENYNNLFECVYWSIASLTAGAEGIAPVTVAGKLLTIVLVMIGLGVVAVPSGLLASALSRQDHE